MTHPFKLAKLLGAHLSNHQTGESVSVNQLRQEACTCTVVGLYFAYANTADGQESRTNEFTGHLVRLYKTLQDVNASTVQQGSSEYIDVAGGSVSTSSSTSDMNSEQRPYKFHVVMISIDEHDKSVVPPSNVTPNTKGSNLNVTPFLVFSNEDRSNAIQEHLIRKYTIQEAPTLILIDANSGRVININAVSHIFEAISSSIAAKQFPWPLPTCSDLIFSSKLITHSNSTISTSPTTESSSLSVVDPQNVLEKDGLRGLLFSAYWCPPCRVFAKQLQDVYQKLNEKFKFQVIYVSSDRSQDSFDRFMSSMPWFGIPFSDEQRRLDLTAAMNVKAIPTLIIIDSKDNIITTEGRADLNDDLDALDFPWKTKLVEELHDRHSSVLNNNVCLIYFIGDDDAEYEKAESILHPIAVEQIDASDVEEAFEVKFFIATDSELAESMRLFIDLDESASYILILDIPNFRYAVTSTEEVSDEKSTNDFLRKFQNSDSEVKYRYIQSRFI